MLRRHSRLDHTGSRHFITTVTRERGAWFTENRDCELILTLFEKYRAKYELDCFGYVLMPDHVHALFIQTADGPQVTGFMNSFKRETSKQLNIEGYPQAALWRERYDDVPIPGPDAFTKRIQYMHMNPVRRGLVEKPEEYRWSSAGYLYGVAEETIVKLALR